MPRLPTSGSRKRKERCLALIKPASFSAKPLANASSTDSTSAGRAAPQHMSKDDGPRENRIRSEFQRLFNFSGRSCPPDRRKRSQTFGGRKFPSSGNSKRSRPRLWTHEFVLLASNKEVHIPSGIRRYELDTAGLGGKTVSFSEEADAEEVHEMIISMCEELGKTGYELLRVPVSGGKELTIIPVPSEGYTVRYLKTVLNQAKCYVRPVQKSLQVVSKQNASVCSVTSNHLLLQRVPY